MTLSQLKYVLKVAEMGHFGKAADALGVTQPTLSMMIKKLEEELGVVLLDRSQKPIAPTKVGQIVFKQANRVLREAARMKDIIEDFSHGLQGKYSLGLIPTIAPFLVPHIIDILLREYPKLNLYLYEEQTEILIKQLVNGEVDAAILATPISHDDLLELPLFYEEFLVFGELEKKNKEFLLPTDINPNKLWLLEEGHCLRSQIINLCELKKEQTEHIHYNAASLETLIEVVRHNRGITILPELTAKKLSLAEQKTLGKFKTPAPYREMSLVIHKHSAKHKFIEAIQDVIEEIIPLSMRKLKANSRVVEL